jgi:hypothetical protein
VNARKINPINVGISIGIGLSGHSKRSEKIKT